MLEMGRIFRTRMPNEQRVLSIRKASLCQIGAERSRDGSISQKQMKIPDNNAKIVGFVVHAT